MAELTPPAEEIVWIVINEGGGPTDDKPAVTLETPPDLDRVSSFLNIRVKDIEAVYAEWSARGAQFLTPPKQHKYEIRCYIRDPLQDSSSKMACSTLPSSSRGGLRRPNAALHARAITPASASAGDQDGGPPSCWPTPSSRSQHSRRSTSPR
jgi:hypothetical protein